MDLKRISNRGMEKIPSCFIMKNRGRLNLAIVDSNFVLHRCIELS